MSQKVVLVHGVASKRFWMRFLARRLSLFGYQAESWGYNSLFGDLERHARRLHSRLLELENDPGVHTLHLVAHSMGSIIVRLALSYGGLNKIGRIVLLAPPNHGSLVATIVGPVFKSFCPALWQLSNLKTSFVQNLKLDSSLAIGIVAAKFDVMVSQKSTQLANARDHICVMATHNTLLFQPNVSVLVDRFLRTEQFSE